MKTTALLLLIIAAFIDTVRAAIDLTPTTTERKQAGVTFQELNFRENGRRITYEQPRGWTYSGGGPRIRFVPPESTQAYAEIDHVPLPAPQNFDEPTKKALQQQTLASVPPDSQNVAFVAEALNPVVLNQHQSYEVTISYQAFGQEFMAGVIYVNLPDTQLRFRTVARKADFEKVHTAFRRSIFSWQWR